jgi:hypothetical protein
VVAAPRRLATGLAAVLVVTGAALGGFGAGCSHEVRPVAQPDDQPPPPALPPASGTPIGYLVDAGELKLNDDQLAKLKLIDDDLATKLMYVESMQRSASAEPDTNEHSRGRVGFGITSENNGLADGVATAPAPDSPALSPTAGGGPARETNADILKRVPQARASVVRAAIARALAVLDAGQKKIARQVLKERGVDPDTGRFEAAGEPGRSRGSDGN